jgi:hypothetical protein
MAAGQVSYAELKNIVNANHNNYVREMQARLRRSRLENLSEEQHRALLSTPMRKLDRIVLLEGDDAIRADVILMRGLEELVSTIREFDKVNELDDYMRANNVPEEKKRAVLNLIDRGHRTLRPELGNANIVPVGGRRKKTRSRRRRIGKRTIRSKMFK